MEALYADIIVDISHEKLDKTFQYKIPDRLAEKLETGMCVNVPFGNGNKLDKGYVVEIGTVCKFEPERMKEIQGIVPGGVSIEDKMIALAGWIRKNYGSTMIQALKTVLPAKQTVRGLEHRKIIRNMEREELISLLGECKRKKQVAKERLLQALLEQAEIPYEGDRKAWYFGIYHAQSGGGGSAQNREQDRLPESDTGGSTGAGKAGA